MIDFDCPPDEDVAFVVADAANIIRTYRSSSLPPPIALLNVRIIACAGRKLPTQDCA